MRDNILIIGNNSFIGINLFNFFKEKKIKVKKISFEQFKKINDKELFKFSIIINCSISNKYVKNNYNYKNDFDLFIANKIKESEIKLIFISTRKVYYPKANISEANKCNPISNYANNKLITEKKLENLLNKKLLILRVSNILGYKGKISKRKIHNTFLDIFVKNIKQKKVINNEKIFKDFITINQFAKIVHKLIINKSYGIFNISFGRKVYLYKLIDWLLKFNKNKLNTKKLTNFEKKKLEFRSFFLNNTKLKKKISINLDLDEIKQECLKISKKIFYEKSL